MATLALLETDDVADTPAFTLPNYGPDPLVFTSKRGAQTGSPALPTAYERGSYQASAGARPIALLASAGAILAIVGAMATLNVVAAYKQQTRLTTVQIRELDVTPPPPPPEPTKLETPEAARTQTVVPPPMIALPASGPSQVVVDTPPPPVPVQVTSQGTAVSAPPAIAPKPATTVEGGDLSSKVLYAKPPSYPTDARRAREQGTVKLMVLVGADGTVKDIKVSGSSGSDRLDRAALHAVKRWRWSPTMSGGVATAVRGTVTIPFVLTPAAG